MHRHDGHRVRVLIEVEAIRRHLRLVALDEAHERPDAGLELIPPIRAHVGPVDVDDRSDAFAIGYRHRCLPKNRRDNRNGRDPRVAEAPRRAVQIDGYAVICEAPERPVRMSGEQSLCPR